MQEMKIKINPNEIIFLFEFIDEDATDSISYTEFINVVKGFRTIDVEKVIHAKRARLGLDQGIDHEEIMRNNYKSMEASVDRRENNSAGTAPGLSEIMNVQSSDAK